MKLGKAFSDSLVSVKRSSGRSGKISKISWWLGSGRVLTLATVFFLAFFLLIVRLFKLTVIEGHNYRRLSDSNRTRELVRHAPRGNLLDRTGKLLTNNQPQYRLLKPCENPAILCSQTLSLVEGEKLQSQGLPQGWFLETDYQRLYPYSSALAHVIGYTGELSSEELQLNYYKLRNYRPGDRVGRGGAEASLEERLRGKDGKEMVEVDATNQILRTLGTQVEIPGEDILLSLDLGLAQVIEQAFPAEARGAVVVTKPTTGEILALFSSPGFDANRFSLGLTSEEYRVLTSDAANPLFNRAIGGTYPPGSTFKIVTALAGLEEKAITRDTIVEDTGVINVGLFSFPNWYYKQYGKTEGPVDIIKALQRSNDIFFYKTAEWLGISRLVGWAQKIGIGKTLGIELSGEATGLMPDPVWKNAHFQTPADLTARNNEWYLGDTYHVAIGQGYLLTTPLQVNNWTNLIANGGKLCPPTIEKKSGEAGSRSARQKCRDVGIKKENIELIREGMKRACEPGGTGWPLFNFSVKREALNVNAKESSISASRIPHTAYTLIPVACKTGTAEYGDPAGRTHAWFTAFAPVPQRPQEAQESQDRSATPETLSGEPEISVTVLVEGAGEGSNVAAPIAKKIFEVWFSR